MATLFGRKYMRGRPGPVEKAVGLAVLALLGGTVAVFLLTSGLCGGFVNAHPGLARIKGFIGISEQPLFVANPRSLLLPASSRPTRVARVASTGRPVGTPATPHVAAAVPAAGKPKPGVARFAEVPGGKLVAPTRTDRYTDNLYEKIDGKESAFRAFDVVDLKFGQYAEPDNKQLYDVYIYDMAAAANATGIYMSERVENPAILPIGREGYASGTSVFCWQGQYYVNVMGPPDGGDAALGASKQIAAAITETIADDGRPFWAEASLPAENRVAHSLSYQASSALGYDFLNRVFFAKYEVGGKKLEMFVAKAVNAPAAASMFGRFAESTARYDKVVSRNKLEGGELMVSESAKPGKPSRFRVAFCKGPYFGGVAPCEDRELVTQRARAFFDKLSAGDPGDPAAVATPPVAKPQADHGSSASEPSEGSESGH